MIRVLIVDDHEIVREGLKTILQDEPDFEIVGQSGTAERLTQLADETRPDVILLDARLPGVSGAEACRRLTISHPDVAVLMISTYSDQQLVEECIRAGAKGYVVKDIERFTLKESIRALHAGGGAVSPTVAATVLDRAADLGRPAGADASRTIRCPGHGLAVSGFAVGEAASEGIDCRGELVGADRWKRESGSVAGVGDRLQSRRPVEVVLTVLFAFCRARAAGGCGFQAAGWRG